MSAALSKKIKELDEENNLMWDEIREMSAIIPDRSGSNVSIDDRQSYLAENTKKGLAEGKHSPPKNLITSKNYRGPEIRPLMPKYV
jgi:hypothetical protein